MSIKGDYMGGAVFDTAAAERTYGFYELSLGKKAVMAAHRRHPVRIRRGAPDRQSADLPGPEQINRYAAVPARQPGAAVGRPRLCCCAAVVLHIWPRISSGC